MPVWHKLDDVWSTVLFWEIFGEEFGHNFPSMYCTSTVLRRLAFLMVYLLLPFNLAGSPGQMIQFNCWLPFLSSRPYCSPKLWRRKFYVQQLPHKMNTPTRSHGYNRTTNLRYSNLDPHSASRLGYIAVGGGCIPKSTLSSHTTSHKAVHSSLLLGCLNSYRSTEFTSVPSLHKYV